MKRWILISLTLVPFIAGHIINSTLAIPVLGIALYYVLPLLTTVFWFWLARQYARNWRTIPASLIGNGAGIFALFFDLWQRTGGSDSTINLTLAYVSQLFSNSAPTYLLAKVAVLFEKQPNFVGERAIIALHILSVLYMAGVFFMGMMWEKKQHKR